MSTDQSSIANLLLRACSAGDFALLQPHLERLKLELAQVLIEADAPIEYVHFLNGGVASVVAEPSDLSPTEIGIFGREGVSGVSGLLGAGKSPHQTMIQLDGSSCWRMPLEKLLEFMNQSETLRTLLLRYVHTLMVQVASTAVTNAHYHMEARLARWLLMCGDRIDGDELSLTHEYMAVMIGAQRTGVTVTLHILEGVGAIRSLRGRVILVDREKLAELAGESFGGSEDEYRRLIGPFGHARAA